MSEQPSIVSALYYDRKPEAVAARTIRSSLAPSNGASFAGHNAQTIRLSVPCGVNGQFLNPQQTFLKLSVTPTTACAVDGSIYQMIQRLTITHNGVQLENIDGYGFLANMLLDLTVDAQQRANDQQIMLGTTSGTAGIPLTAGAKTWFNFPILSSLFTMQDKYLPVGSCVGDLNIEITLDPAAFVWAPAVNASYTVADVELMTEIVVLTPGVTKTINDTTMARDGAFKIPLVQWRNYNTTIAGGQTAASMLVPFKLLSMKNILVGMRHQESVTSISASKWTRVGGSNLKQYWWQVSGEQKPARPVNDVYEAYCELQKSIHDLSIGNGNSILSRDTYKADRFMIGLELEAFSHRSDAINTGINTMGINIHFAPEFTEPMASNKVTRVDFYAHYDSILTIDSTGQCMVSG